MISEAISYDDRNTIFVIPTALTPKLCVILVIESVVPRFLIIIPSCVSQQNNAVPHTADVTQHDLQSVNIMSWPTRSKDLSPFEHTYDIIGRQI